MRPFKITFKTDSNELTTASGTAETNEESFVPGGIVGFQLSYAQPKGSHLDLVRDIFVLEK